MILPTITDSSDCKSYFHEFLEINKSVNPKYSRRYWSKKLGWPVSYFDQVIKGQKAFSIRRCIEFIDFAKMDSLAAEKLLLLVLKSDSKDLVKTYAESKLKKASQSFQMIENNLDAHGEQAFWITLVHCVLRQYEYLPTPNEIRNRLYFFPKVTNELIQEAIEYLLEHKIFSIDQKNKLINNQVVLNRVASKQTRWQEWAKFYVNSYESGIAASKSDIPHLAASHGFLYIPNDRLEDVKQKLFAFYDSLNALGSSSFKSNADSNKHTLFQYGLSIFPVLKDNRDQ